MIIYKTVNLINGKIYIGKDTHNNPFYFGSGTLIRQAIKKYGKENFVKIILQNCKTLKQLDKRENYWIKKLKSQNKNIGYNIRNGGEGGNKLQNFTSEQKSKIYKKSEETKRKISESHKGNKLSEYHKQRVSEGQIGRKLSEETKRKMSESHKGKKKTAEHIKNNLEARRKNGTLKHTDESKRKMSESRKGKIPWNKGIKFSDEQKKKMSETKTKNRKTKLGIQ